MKVSFDSVIEGLRTMRDDFVSKSHNDPIESPKNHYRAEYCYQLVSLLMESQKLLNKEFYSPDYIDEKSYTLNQISKRLGVIGCP